MEKSRQIKVYLDTERDRVRSAKCPEIEGEALLFNCLYYNLSPKCFINNFGERGIEIGEVIDDDARDAFESCWKTELSIYQRDPYELRRNRKYLSVEDEEYDELYMSD